MKLKARVAAILATCVFMMISFGLFFHYSQPELQVSESHHIIVKLLGRQRVSTSGTVKAGTPSEKHHSNKHNISISSVATVAGMKINAKLQEMNFTSDQYKKDQIKILQSLISDVETKLKLMASVWNIAAVWVKAREIHPENAPEMGTILSAMSSGRIIHAGVGYKGTQLKIMLTLEGGQQVVFKPMRFSRDYIITGPPYAGADRHNGEIAAFHLNRLLGFQRSPLVVGREVNLRLEIKPVASETLLKTFMFKDNNTCFYGHCYYCTPSDPACGKGDLMEGAVILWLPERYTLKKYRNPWQRTYKDQVPARWEMDFKYCERVQRVNTYKTGPRLLDLIDSAIFDYLIGNADRHHYEVFADLPDSMIIFLDNGKSFGNPYWDELTVLAPLYQCCRIRRSTYKRLWTFVDSLGWSMKELLSHDVLSPILIQPHLNAFDRRLRTILAAIEVCLDEKGEDNVIVDFT